MWVMGFVPIKGNASHPDCWREIGGKHWLRMVFGIAGLGVVSRVRQASDGASIITNIRA